MAESGSPEPSGQQIAIDIAAIRSQSVGRVWCLTNEEELDGHLDVSQTFLCEIGHEGRLPSPWPCVLEGRAHGRPAVSLLVSYSTSQRETDQTGSETLAASWLADSRAAGSSDLLRPILIGQRPNTEVRFPYGTAD